MHEYYYTQDLEADSSPVTPLSFSIFAPRSDGNEFYCSTNDEEKAKHIVQALNRMIASCC